MKLARNDAFRVIRSENSISGGSGTIYAYLGEFHNIRLRSRIVMGGEMEILICEIVELTNLLAHPSRLRVRHFLPVPAACRLRRPQSRLADLHRRD